MQSQSTSATTATSEMAEEAAMAMAAEDERLATAAAAAAAADTAAAAAAAAALLAPRVSDGERMSAIVEKSLLWAFLGPAFYSILKSWFYKKAPRNLRDLQGDALDVQVVWMLENHYFDSEMEHLLSLSVARQASDNKALTLEKVTPSDVLGDDLLALVPVGHGVSREGNARTSFKPRMPDSKEFSGPSGGENGMSILKNLSSWIEGVQGNCRLAAMEEAQSVFFASQLLRGSAKTWWSSWAKASTCTTWKELRDGLTLYFVGPQPFELLCKELSTKSLKDFSRYEGFKAWFTGTVTNMRVYAPTPDRMWAENVLIDSLLLALTDSLYYEAVVVDSVTSSRPSTLGDALRLLDDRHHVLLKRKAAHGVKDVAGPSHGGGNGGGNGSGGGNAGRVEKKRKGGGNGGGHKDGGLGGKTPGPDRKKTKGGGPSAGPLVPRDQYNAKKFGISETEARRRWDARVCLKCGESGHMANSDKCRLKEN